MPGWASGHALGGGGASPSPASSPLKRSACPCSSHCPGEVGGGSVTMGSKMAAASRVVQVVKPHMPLIKFPDRRSTPKPKIQEPLQSRVPPLHASSSQLSAGGGPASQQNISFSGRIQGTPDTAELVRTLPQKYRRKPINTEEMEYIQRGGPE